MQTLDPSGDPGQAYMLGWCVDRLPHLRVVATVIRRLELEPWSVHLLVGGIGSGKTTELWGIQQHLKTAVHEVGAICEYVDVGSRQRLDHVRPGVLVALAGKRLAELEAARRGARPATKEVKDANYILHALADGYVAESWERQEYEETVVPGVVEPPVVATGPLTELVPSLAVLKRAVAPGADGHCVFLFDSLDRMPPDEFENAIAHDVRALRSAGIGAVIVGPMRFRYGAAHAIADLFEQNVHSLADVELNPMGLTFLTQVLRRRAPIELLDDGGAHAVALGSGGVMRDLIAIAKSAAQEAYVDGSDAIHATHVARAIEQLGRVRAVGLDGEQVAALRKVRETGTMVIRGERELVLLETRRVLDFGNGRFAVHPALAPLLDVMTAAA